MRCGIIDRAAFREHHAILLNRLGYRDETILNVPEYERWVSVAGRTVTAPTW
jgi:hypothetical protein